MERFNPKNFRHRCTCENCHTSYLTSYIPKYDISMQIVEDIYDAYRCPSVDCARQGRLCFRDDIFYRLCNRIMDTFGIDITGVSAMNQLPFMGISIRVSNKSLNEAIDAIKEVIEKNNYSLRVTYLNQAIHIDYEGTPSVNQFDKMSDYGRQIWMLFVNLNASGKLSLVDGSEGDTESDDTDIILDELISIAEDIQKGL